MRANSQLNKALLLVRAADETGLSDFGEDSWEEGLDRLIHSLHAEGDLSEVGEVVAAAMITDFLKSRLWVIDWHQRHPEIGTTMVSDPVLVIGQPRTGTTILFDLLAQDPSFRVPLTWEVAQPHPPPETATYHTDPRIGDAAIALAMSETLNPGFQSIHPSGPLRGQECVAITAGDFRSLLFSTAFHVPSYTRWLVWEADMAPAYRYHRKFLQLLQWRHAERTVAPQVSGPSVVSWRSVRRVSQCHDRSDSSRSPQGTCLDCLPDGAFTAHGPRTHFHP